jgi:hypothetical protein
MAVTVQDAKTMPAGTMMNWMVGKHVMELSALPWTYPPYSENHECSREVVEQMMRQGWVFRFLAQSANSYYAWFEKQKGIHLPEDPQPDLIYCGKGETEPEAICRAALMTIAEGLHA